MLALQALRNDHTLTCFCHCNCFTESEAINVKPGLHIVVTIAEHASDDAPKRTLKLSTHRMQIFLLKYEYLHYNYGRTPI